MNNEVLNNSNMINDFPKKKKNVALIVGLSIVGTFVLIVATVLIILFIESNQEKSWKSGEIKILGNVIKLPCKVDEFESMLNTKLIPSEYSSITEINYVNITLEDGDSLVFDVYVENDMVTGIMIEAYESNEEDKEYETTKMERDTALNIIFPDNVTIETSIEKVKKLYSTKPFNFGYNYFSEDIGGHISASHKFSSDDWEINFSTKDNEITEIDYYYQGEIE